MHSYEGKLSLHIKDDPRAFYRNARSNMKMKDAVGPMTDDFSSIIPDDDVNVKLLNEYFASIFTEENLMDMSMCDRDSYANALNTVVLQKRQCIIKSVTLGPTNLLVLMEYIQLC